MSAIEPVKRRWPEDRSRIPVSPQLALRVTVIGGLAMVMFGVIFFRLWYLQVLSSEQYVQQANANRERELPIAAPRGEILDRGGQAIVTSTTTNAVQIVPSALPPAGRRRLALYRRLGRVLGMSAKHIQALVIREREAVPYAPVTIKTDAGHRVLTELGERQSEFPGVQQQPVAIREYPFGDMAAQVLGYVGEVSEPELEKRAFSGVKQGTIVGQAGLEYYYDSYLRGEPGEQRVAVNAAGYPVPTKLAPRQPRAGHSLQTTLDLGLQRSGEKALLEGMERARAGGKPAVGGAFVALDPLNGEVLAMGSYPTFNPDKFAKPLTEAEYKALRESGDVPGPLTNRAAEGAYPTGSTFKPITAMAALEAGVITPEEGLGAGQCIDVGGEQFCNAGHADYGAVGLVEALKVSSDTYFFEVGRLSNAYGEIIQRKAKELGVGVSSHLDLPSQFAGVVPSPKWLAEQNELESKCRRRHHGHPCYIVAEPGAPWTVGYNMDLAVGQGSLETNPLQMAVAYSALATAYRDGGEATIVTPHIGKQIDDADGSLVQTLRFPARHLHLDDADVNLVMQGIHEAASEPGGTSTEVWAGWDQSEDPVFGKTGTAERLGHLEQSWYMCYIGNAQRPIVIAVTVEEGGFGAETAAPIARLIASQWYGKQKRFVAGSSKTF
ncbi:MAG TPA: penicillin-binding protein 2 [Solirubrobacteraceae bacterium]|nr:penicillin-binding protein 2 [Solirubrobacteraceae bacterium]